MRIVIKVGTSTLAHSTGMLNIRHVEDLCKVLSDLKNSGHEMILVSLFKGRLCIRGRGLTIAAMERKSIVIKGKIYGIDLE